MKFTAANLRKKYDTLLLLKYYSHNKRSFCTL